MAHHFPMRTESSVAPHEEEDLSVVPIGAPVRRCATCPTILSQYNHEDQCNPCQKRDRKSLPVERPTPSPRSMLSGIRKVEPGRRPYATPISRYSGKTCIVAGCDQQLSWENKSGRCTRFHGYICNGTKMKDGTLWVNEKAPKRNAAPRTFGIGPAHRVALDDRPQKVIVLDAIKNGARTSRELAERTGLGIETCSAICSLLRGAGAIQIVQMEGRLIHWGIVQKAPDISTESTAPEEVTLTVEANVMGGHLDKLTSRTIKIEDLPPEKPRLRPPMGRSGALWAKLLALAPGHAEEVENRDERHAGNTLVHIRRRAKEAGRVLLERKVGSMLYLWLEPEKKGSK